MVNKFGQHYKRKVISRKLRLAVYERDDFTCQYCGVRVQSEELQVDHIIPISRGGTNDINNLITSCATCNKKKGARLPHVHNIRQWEQGKQVPDANKLELLADALNTTIAYLYGEPDNSQHENADEKNMHSPTIKIENAIKNPSFIEEYDFIGSGRVLMYEDKDKGRRYVFPATRENQAWFRKLVTAAITGNAETQV